MPTLQYVVLKDSVGVVNAASNFRRKNIQVRVNDENSISKAGQSYANGDCDVLVGTSAELAAERSLLEDPQAHEIVQTAVAPLIVNTPAPAGFNIQGGTKLSPEFAALLAGLVLYTSAFAAEIVRAGILAVSKGQSEAARALGLSEGQTVTPDCTTPGDAGNHPANDQSIFKPHQKLQFGHCHCLSRFGIGGEHGAESIGFCGAGHPGFYGLLPYVEPVNFSVSELVQQKSSFGGAVNHGNIFSYTRFNRKCILPVRTRYTRLFPKHCL